MGLTITCLGVRGSIPVSGPSFAHFGMATTCFLIKSETTELILDAGSGLHNYPAENSPEVHILLTHPHMDHLLGLPLFSPLFHADTKVHLYGKMRNHESLKEQISHFLTPPLWPVTLDQFPAEVYWHELESSMQIGDIQIQTMEGVHPGGSSLFRFTCGMSSAVIMTDCTITSECSSDILSFADSCDVLFCDGQYSEEEWPLKKEYGHNTWSMAANFALEAKAKKIRIVHHDPDRTDSQLLLAEPQLRNIHPDSSFAYEGEEVQI